MTVTIVTVTLGLCHVSEFDFLHVLYLVTKRTAEDSPYCIWEKWSKNTGSLILSFCLKNNSKLKITQNIVN